MKTKILISLASFILCSIFSIAKCACSLNYSVHSDGMQTVACMMNMTTQTQFSISMQPGDSIYFFVGSSHNCYTNQLYVAFNNDTLFYGPAGDPDPGFYYSAMDSGHYHFDYFYGLGM